MSRQDAGSGSQLNFDYEYDRACHSLTLFLSTHISSFFLVQL